MIPELRELIEVAQKYLKGDVHFSHVSAKTADVMFYAKQLDNSRIRKLAEAWHRKSLQVWDEWGSLEESERITEDEYKEWVRSELSVIHDEFDFERHDG